MKKTNKSRTFHLRKVRDKKIAGVKWIFFDLDGTLADTIPALYKAYLNFLNNFKKRGTRKEFAILNGPSLPEIVSYLKTKHNLKSSYNDLLRLYGELVLNSYSKVGPMDNAQIVLQKLNKLNHKLMLVTSANRDIALKFVSNQGWQKYFQNYVFGNEMKKAKPDPAIYKLALKKAGVYPAAAITIEDSTNGVSSAKQAGTLVVGLAKNETKNSLLKAGADLVIFELQDILPFLSG